MQPPLFLGGRDAWSSRSSGNLLHDIQALLVTFGAVLLCLLAAADVVAAPAGGVAVADVVASPFLRCCESSSAYTLQNVTNVPETGLKFSPGCPNG